MGKVVALIIIAVFFIVYGCKSNTSKTIDEQPPVNPPDVEEHFTQTDTNKIINQSEKELREPLKKDSKAENLNPKEAFEKAPDPDRQGPPPPERGEHGPPPGVEEIFKQMDNNKDGKLSLEEVKGPIKNDFSKIDLNNDGFISKEELEKAPKPDRQGPPPGQDSPPPGNSN